MTPTHHQDVFSSILCSYLTVFVITPSFLKNGFSSQAIVVHVFDPSTQEAQADRSLWVQELHGLKRKYQDSQDHFTKKPCLKKKKIGLLLIINISKIFPKRNSYLDPSRYQRHALWFLYVWQIITWKWIKNIIPMRWSNYKVFKWGCLS